ncbi:LPS assembly lipoprotein LptE [Dyella sp.]|uniref:LPS-assembly lipoprotein LptE n=1 Tax=Dyella sp. TaxID=1869338 RepID=UPI002D76F09F|nr:LPS assembly lipoprotein LptE [Dyella sp.]HET6433708.1 LPS assembly lipoprotein LptE [Dyella sp.]
MSRIASRFPLLLSALAVLLLAGCGFHLRQSVALPESMQRMHLTVSDRGDLQRNLARALRGSGVTVEDASGPGIAELAVTQAAFSTDKLSISGTARVTEYSVQYVVKFHLVDSDGTVLLPEQTIQMAREYSYDATNTIGNDSQVEQIQRSLIDDTVQSMLFRLRAAARHADAPAAGTP